MSSTTSTAAISTDSAPTMSPHTQTLDDHIASLPQELQDEILEYFCLAQAESVKNVTVDKVNYRPPYFLQLTRQTRAIAAPTYYDRTAFSFVNHNVIKTLKLWLTSLPSAHRACVRTLEITTLLCFDPSSSFLEYAMWKRLGNLLDMGWTREDGILRMCYMLPSGERKLKCWAGTKDVKSRSLS